MAEVKQPRGDPNQRGERPATAARTTRPAEWSVLAVASAVAALVLSAVVLAARPEATPRSSAIPPAVAAPAPRPAVAPSPAVPARVTISGTAVSGPTAKVEGSATPSDAVARLRWDWGDGSSSEGPFPQSHTYARPGSYAVKVDAIDGQGRLVGTTGVTLAVTSAAPTPAVTPAPARRAVFLDPPSSPQGSVVVVKGSGFTPKSRVVVRYAGADVEGATTDEKGEFAAKIAVPGNASTGSPNAVTVLDRTGATASADHIATPLTAAVSRPPTGPSIRDQLLAHPSGRPLVPGGPPFYPEKLVRTRGFQTLLQHHQTTLPLWTRATYGGELRVAGAWNPGATLQLLRTQRTDRPSYAGMLLLLDMGRCSMIDRGDFSRCNGRYGRNDEVAIIPGIFEQWNQPEPHIYDFKVRRGVLWPQVPPMNRSDREVTAQDIVHFLEITAKEGALKGNLEPARIFEALDRYTVRIVLQSPHAGFLRNMAHPSMGIFPRECWEAADCLGNKLVSPGPFLLEASKPGEKAVFARNPDFWLKGLPYLDRFSLINIVDPTAQQAAFITGEIDVSAPVLTLSEVESIRKRVPNVQVQAVTLLAGGTVLRPSLRGPLADVRVRRAMALAMDLPTLWESTREGFALFPTLVGRDEFGPLWYPVLEQPGPAPWYGLDLAKAKQLLAEAGYPNGFKTGILTFTGSGKLYDTPQVLQANWKKLGIQVDLKVVSVAESRVAFNSRNWDGLYHQPFSSPSPWPDADSAMASFVSGNSLNYQDISDPRIDDLYKKWRVEPDPAKRAAMLWEFEQYELSQLYTLRLATVTGFVLSHPWELNGASHGVSWLGAGPGAPTWLAMLDPSRRPAAAPAPARAITSAAFQGKISVDPTVSYPASPLRVKGTGFTPRSTVVVQYDGADMEKFDTDDRGAFFASFPVPANASIGSFNTVVVLDRSGATAAAWHTAVTPGRFGVIGKLLYLGKPMTDLTRSNPSFTLGARRPGQSCQDAGPSRRTSPVQAHYDGNSPVYYLEVLNPGDYCLFAYVDAEEPFNGIPGMAGDFVSVAGGWGQEVSLGPGSAPLDIEFHRVLHLTSPADNRIPIFGQGQGALGPYQSPLRVTWEPVPGAGDYILTARLCPGGDCAKGQSVHQSSTQDTQYWLDLPPSKEQDIYFLFITATGTGGEAHALASLSFGYAGGGWTGGLPFRIAPAR